MNIKKIVKQNIMIHCFIGTVHSTDRLNEDLGVSEIDLVAIASRIYEY